MSFLRPSNRIKKYNLTAQKLLMTPAGSDQPEQPIDQILKAQFIDSLEKETV